jgi:hypothetical protein
VAPGNIAPAISGYPGLVERSVKIAAPETAKCTQPGISGYRRRPRTSGIRQWPPSRRGTAAVDLAFLDLAAYAETVLPHWRNSSFSELSRLQRAGRLLQSVAAIEWATRKLPYEPATVDITWLEERILAELNAVLDH